MGSRGTGTLMPALAHANHLCSLFVVVTVIDMPLHLIVTRFVVFVSIVYGKITLSKILKMKTTTINLTLVLLNKLRCHAHF